MGGPHGEDTLATAEAMSSDLPTVAGHREPFGPTHFVLVFGAREYPLERGDVVIGRSPEAAIIIESRAISRRHARLTTTSGGVTIEDLGSKNGTFVDGNRLDSPVEMHHGAHFRLGPIWLTLRVSPREP